MTDIESQIKDLDASLQILSEARASAKEVEKEKWSKRIDDALDKRMFLMRQREASKGMGV